MLKPIKVTGNEFTGHIIRIVNRSLQTIPIQVGPPNGDFYLSEQQIHLGRGQSVELPKDHVRMDQVNNLKARGMLSVTFDSQDQ